MDVISLLIVGGILLLFATLIVAAGDVMSAPEPQTKTAKGPRRFSSLRVQCPQTGQLAGIDVFVENGSLNRLTVFRCERFGNLPPKCMQKCVRSSPGTVFAS